MLSHRHKQKQSVDNKLCNKKTLFLFIIIIKSYFIDFFYVGQNVNASFVFSLF